MRIWTLMAAGSFATMAPDRLDVAGAAPPDCPAATAVPQAGPPAQIATGQATGVPVGGRTTLTGFTRDLQTGAPIPYATVEITGLGLRVISDQQGRYTIQNLVAGTQIRIQASRVRYGSRQADIVLSGAVYTIDLLMSTNVLSMDAVVSAATGGDPSRGIKTPFATTRLSGDQLPVPSLANAALSIAGKVAGVVITPTNDPRANTEEHGRIDEQTFTIVRDVPLSTFGVDVDRASFSNVRRFICGGQMPPKDAVRIEELINYFDYDYPLPRGADPVSVATEIVTAPWNAAHRIMRVGLRTAPIDVAKLPPSNLVFLIDVSGSMAGPTRLPLAQQAFRLLVEQLREQDRVAIVVYASDTRIVLPPTSGAERWRILAAIDGLAAGGSTAGGAGLQLAYDVASKNFLRGGNNRVVLATDGDFNIGISNTGDLLRFVEQRRAEGIALTALGFGMGNYKDNRIEQLADHGDGNAAYIDDIEEARKVFVNEMSATLVTAAKDVKVQVEFNPAHVRAYRLIGYENRALAARDFVNDRKDAGDMGAGHTVTALYEIIPAGAPSAVDSAPPLRYQPNVRASTPVAMAAELASVNIRYKTPTGDASKLIEHRVAAGPNVSGDDNTRFALAVAGYGMLLRGSPNRGVYTFENVLAHARGALGDDRERYRAGFLDMVLATRNIAR
jgi:Ca-activated chloride channel family protein